MFGIMVEENRDEKTGEIVTSIREVPPDAPADHSWVWLLAIAAVVGVGLLIYNSVEWSPNKPTAPHRARPDDWLFR
jgi:hypothetical protein